MKKYLNNYEDIDQKIVKQVRYQASKLMRDVNIRASMEREDLEQEFMLAILKSMVAYNREKAKLSTFASHILNHKAKTIIEKLLTAKRNSRECCLLDLENEIYYDPINVICLSIDLDRAFCSLPEPLALLLMQLRTHNVHEISRLTNMPHSTLYLSLKKLRACLSKRGFYNYS